MFDMWKIEYPAYTSQGIIYSKRDLVNLLRTYNGRVLLSMSPHRVDIIKDLVPVWDNSIDKIVIESRSLKTSITIVETLVKEQLETYYVGRGEFYHILYLPNGVTLGITRKLNKLKDNDGISLCLTKDKLVPIPNTFNPMSGTYIVPVPHGELHNIETVEELSRRPQLH